MRTNTPQTNFVGGEITPLLLGRADVERFSISGELVENFQVQSQGPLQRRRGVKNYFNAVFPCPVVRLHEFALNRNTTEMLIFGCGAIQVGVPELPTPGLVEVTVEAVTYEGGFLWYGFLPYMGATVDADQVPIRYLRKSASGRNRFLHAFSGLLSACPEFGESGTFVAADNEWGGQVVVNYLDGTLGGAMTNQQTFPEGFVCAGSSYSYPPPGFQQTLELSPTNSSANFGLHFISRASVGPTQKRWGVGPSTCPGYVVSYCGAGIGGVEGDWVQESLSDPNTIPKAAEAADAQLTDPELRSEITSYNSLTGEMQGLATNLTITYKQPATAATYTVAVTFRSEPTGGGLQELFTIEETHEVIPGEEPVFTIDIPMIEGKTVTYVSAVFSLFDYISDDFEGMAADSLLVGVVREYVSPGWPEADGLPIFGFDPSIMCLSDWEDAFVDPTSVDVWGDYWAGPGTFSRTDALETSDDFENYEAGVIGPWGMGFGWAGLGLSLTVDTLKLEDAFEEYAAGTITSLDLGTGWFGDGYFAIIMPDMPRDDFETYGLGTILAWDEGFGWSDEGTFDTP